MATLHGSASAMSHLTTDARMQRMNAVRQAARIAFIPEGPNRPGHAKGPSASQPGQEDALRAWGPGLHFPRKVARERKEASEDVDRAVHRGRERRTEPMGIQGRVLPALR